MTTGEGLWSRARRVRDQVERRLRKRTDVRMIDISASAAGLPVIMIHVDRPLTLDELRVSSQIEGIPLQVTRADEFRPQ